MKFLLDSQLGVTPVAESVMVMQGSFIVSVTTPEGFTTGNVLDVCVPPSFWQGLADCEEGRVMDMEQALVLLKHSVFITSTPLPLVRIV